MDPNPTGGSVTNYLNSVLGQVVISVDTNELIKSAYNILLNRDPDPEGEVFWCRKLREGMSRHQFLHNMVESDEFQKNKPIWLDLGLWQKCRDLRAEIILDLPMGKFCGPATDSTVFSSILQQNGVYEPHVVKEISRNLKSGDTFIDVGANLGYLTLIAATCVGPNGKVIAFEPSPDAYDYCKKNIELNKLNNVELYKYGLWSEKKTLTISSSQQLGGNHIAEQGDTIECIPLDQLNLSPNLLKIDIEGSEPYALQGMLKTLQRSRPEVIIELNRGCLRSFFGKDTEDVWQPLTDLGYDIYIIPGNKKIRRIEELNTICPKDGLVDLLATSKKRLV